MSFLSKSNCVCVFFTISGEYNALFYLLRMAGSTSMKAGSPLSQRWGEKLNSFVLQVSKEKKCVGQVTVQQWNHSILNSPDTKISLIKTWNCYAFGPSLTWCAQMDGLWTWTSPLSIWASSLAALLLVSLLTGKALNYFHNHPWSINSIKLRSVLQIAVRLVRIYS